MSHLEQLEALRLSVDKLYATRPNSISFAGDPLLAPSNSATHKLLIICEEPIPPTWDALRTALQLQYPSAGVDPSSIQIGEGGMALTLEALEKFEPEEGEKRSYGYWCRKLREGLEAVPLKAQNRVEVEEQVLTPAAARADSEERVEVDQAGLYTPETTPAVTRDRSSAPELPDELKPISYQAPDSPAISSYLSDAIFSPSASPEIMLKPSTSTAEVNLCAASRAAGPSPRSPSPTIEAQAVPLLDMEEQQQYEEQGAQYGAAALTSVVGLGLDKGKGRAIETTVDEEEEARSATPRQRSRVAEEAPRRTSKRKRTQMMVEQGEDGGYESSSDIDEGPESEEEEGAAPAPPDDPRHGKMGPHPPPKVAYWYKDWVTVILPPALYIDEKPWWRNRIKGKRTATSVRSKFVPFGTEWRWVEKYELTKVTERRDPPAAVAKKGPEEIAAWQWGQDFALSKYKLANWWRRYHPTGHERELRAAMLEEKAKSRKRVKRKRRSGKW